MRSYLYSRERKSPKKYREGRNVILSGAAARTGVSKK